MAQDVYHTVSGCHSCAKNGTLLKNKLHLQLFPATGPLEFVALDLLGPLPRTNKGNQYVDVITGRYSKLTRAIPTGHVTSTNVAYIVFNDWVIPYGIPTYILTDNGTQLTSKSFATLCTHLGTKQLTTTAYHPQTNGQVERYNKTIVTRLRHYVAKNQRDWDIFVQPLTYAYRSQVHRSTNTTPFSLVLSGQPLGPASFENNSAFSSDTYYPTEPQALRAHCLHESKHCVPR